MVTRIATNTSIEIKHNASFILEWSTDLLDFNSSGNLVPLFLSRHQECTSTPLSSLL